MRRALLDVERPEDVAPNPFDGSVVDTVCEATEQEIETALSTASEGASVMRRLPRALRGVVL